MASKQLTRLARFDPLNLWQPALLTLAVCVLKIALFDWAIFALRAYPPHDTATALLQFQTNVHAMLSENDLAWWVPTPAGGYAQYYNSFLSPLAPTSAAPLFLIWLLGIKILSTIGVEIPTYIQFVVFEFGISPFITIAAFAMLVSRFTRNWFAIGIATASYGLGGPEIWNNAWMFHQEWPTLFLLFFAFDRFIVAPVAARFAFLVIMLFATAISANYWTIFSSWFVLIFFVFYCIVFWPRVRRSMSVLRNPDFWPSPAARLIVPVLIALPLVGWAAFLWLILREQAKLLANRGSPFSLQAVYERANVADVTRFTTELFNPVQERPIEHYSFLNNDHSAVYIGAALIPLILAFVLQKWRKQHILIAGLCIAVLSIRMTSGVFMALYEGLPLLKSQRHLFYFYQYFLQIALILAAAIGASTLFAKRKKNEDRTSPAICGPLGAAILLGLFISSGYFSVDDPTLKSIGFFAVLLVVSSALIFQSSTIDRRLAYLPAALFLLIHVGDVSRYYRSAERLDQKFSEVQWSRHSDDGRAVDRSSMKAIWPKQGWTSDQDLFKAETINSDLWPKNSFNPSMQEYQRETLSSSIKDKLQSDKALVGIEPISLTIHSSKWAYNRVSFEVSSENDFIAVTQRNFDPYWTATVDGHHINTLQVASVFLAAHVSAGRHSITFEYRPLSRLIFWPLLSLALLSLCVCLVLLLRPLAKKARKC